MSRFFIDTKVLVYADDLDAGTKTAKAQELIERAYAQRAGVLSTQVLQEFFVVTTKKLGVDPATARRKVELLGRLDVVTLELATILAAIDLHRLHSLSLWDALIVKAATIGGCEILYSEDLNHGQVIDGVRIHNPFAD